MMRCVRRVFTVVVLVGFYLAARSSAQLSLAAAGLQLQKNPIPTSDDSVKAGRAVYARFCAGCHGQQGKGDGATAPKNSKPASLVAGEWKHGGSDADIFKTIKEGIGPGPDGKPSDMKPQVKISDEDIWNIVNFLRDLAKRAKP